MKFNVKFNLNHENLIFKFLAFWLKNRSGFCLFIHKLRYRTLISVRITLKKLFRPEKNFSGQFNIIFILKIMILVYIHLCKNY